MTAYIILALLSSASGFITGYVCFSFLSGLKEGLENVEATKAGEVKEAPKSAKPELH